MSEEWRMLQSLLKTMPERKRQKGIRELEADYYHRRFAQQFKLEDDQKRRERFYKRA